MKELYSIENRTWRIVLNDVLGAYSVAMQTSNGGEFKVKFKTLDEASEFFDILAQGIYSYEN